MTRLQVFGERSSGTNFAKRLLGRNTPLKPTEVLGWKHGFPQMIAVPADMVVVCMVRRADDWVRSMHSKPWHTTPAMQRLEMSDFIRAEWDTIIDRDRYWDAAARLGLTGQPLQQDRDPTTGARFCEIFALRRAKLAALLGFAARDCNIVFARSEDVTNAPEAFVDRFRAAFGLPPRDGDFRGIARRLGSKFKPAVDLRPATPDRLNALDMAHLAARVDATQEASLGYVYEPGAAPQKQGG